MEYDIYPEKPSLIENESGKGMRSTIISLLLFIATFVFIFSDDWMFVVNIVIVIFLHELGHFLVMKWYKYKDVKMIFVPLMGAFVQGDKEVLSQKQSLLMVGMGPFPGILFGSGFILFSSVFKSVWMVDIGLMFLFINVLNLLPLDPLDGGQLFKLLIHRDKGVFLLVFSFVSSLILIAFGWYMEMWVLVVIGFFLGFRVRRLQKEYYLRKRFVEEGVKYETTYKDLSNRDFHEIKQILLEEDKLAQLTSQLDEEDAERIIAEQVKDALKKPYLKDAGFLFKTVLVMLWLGVFVVPFLFLTFNISWIYDHFSWYVDQLSN